VTIAIAPIGARIYWRTGKLLLVGTGPGTIRQITPAAQIAIASADVVIGYVVVYRLNAPLLQKEQIMKQCLLLENVNALNAL
jgi:cobalt-precorrin 5A hydrolase/precorrin-3B C17-methyltransferase